MSQTKAETFPSSSTESVCSLLSPKQKIAPLTFFFSVQQQPSGAVAGGGTTAPES